MKRAIDYLRPNILKAEHLHGHTNVTVKTAILGAYQDFKSGTEQETLILTFEQFPTQKFTVANQFNKDFISQLYGEEIQRNNGFDCLIGKKFAIYPHDYPNGQTGVRFMPPIQDEYDKGFPDSWDERNPPPDVQSTDEGEGIAKSKQERQTLKKAVEDYDQENHLAKTTEGVIQENLGGYDKPG